MTDLRSLQRSGFTTRQGKALLGLGGGAAPGGLNFDRLSYTEFNLGAGIFYNNAFVLGAGAQGGVSVPLTTSQASNSVSYGPVTMLGRSALYTPYQGLFYADIQGAYTDLGGDSAAVKASKLHNIVPTFSTILGATPPGAIPLTESFDPSSGARTGLAFAYRGLVIAHGVQKDGDAIPGGLPATWDLAFDKLDSALGATQWSITIALTPVLVDDGTNLGPA